MKEVKTLKRRGGIDRAPNQRLESIESRGELRHLVYWMEHDRSLNVQPDRISRLKKLLLGEQLSVSSAKDQE